MTTTGPWFSVGVQHDLLRVESKLKDLVQHAASQAISPMLAHALEVPGKRVRPTLTLLASQFGSGVSDTVVLMASAVELLHLATLLHDDTVDAASTRRGRATLNSLWGPQAAVLIGDYLFAASATQVCDTGNVRVIRRFAQTIMDLSSGQLLEQLHLYDPAQPRQRYLDRIAAKTASLFATSLESGAVLGHADESTVQALTSYGWNLGMAFQVVDDILDYEGVPEEMGKPVGEDLANGVLTLPALMYLERGPADNPIRTYCDDRSRVDCLERSLRDVRESGIIQEAYLIAEGYRQAALRTASGLADTPARAALNEVAEYVVQRKR